MMLDLRTRAAPLDAIDDVVVVSPTEVTATKTIRVDDPYLEGHYPHFTIYPGVFILESVNQAVDGYLADQVGAGSLAELVTVKSVRFTSPLLPGDTLRIHADVLLNGRELCAKVVCRNGADAKAATMKLEYRIVGGEVDA